MGPLAAIEEFVEDPESLAKSLREQPRPLLGAACYLLGSIGIFLAEALSGRLLVFGPSGASLALVCLWHLCMGAATCAMSHLVAEAMGGRGRAISLFVLFGMSDLGWTVLLPLTLVWLAVFPTARWIAALLAVLTAYWVLWLRARSISHNYGISLGKAWTALFLPYAAAVLAGLAVFSMALWSLLSRTFKLSL